MGQNDKNSNWKDNCKTVKVGGKEVNMKAPNSLFACLLLVARSSREDVDLPAAIGLHEFSNISNMLIYPDGSL